MISPKEVETNQSSDVKAGSIGPGDRLQAARINAGMSVEDVANRMHLSISILEAIEENNFDEITAPIFVKGYLRAYSRIVSLDEEEMIQQYIDFYSDEDPPINSTSNTSPEISADDARIKWTTYIVIIVLCGLLAAWWWSKNQNQGDVVSLDVEPSTEVVAADNDESRTDSVVASQDSSETIIATTAVEEPPVPATVEETPEPAEVTSVEPEASVEPNLPAISDSAEEVAVQTESTSVSETPTEVVSRGAATGSDKLVVTVNADAWADIKDANDEKLAYDLLRADSQLILTGQAPFTAFFGNAHGVELLFNGEKIDISSRTRDDNTARLKIGNN